MRKIALVLSVGILLVLSGCVTNQSSYIVPKEYQGELSAVQKVTDLVLNAEDEKVAEIESDGGLFLVDRYILFSRKASESLDSNHMIDYFCFDLTTRQYSYLGTLENYGTSTFMGVAQMNHHHYRFILHGDPFDGNWTDDDEELRLYDFDLQNKTITHIRTSKYKHPYNDLQAYDDKLLIKDGNLVVEFDTVSREERILLDYPEFNSEKMTGEMVYACFMDTDKSELSVLIIQVNGEENVGLRIDTYSEAMQLIRSIDISEEASQTGNANFSMLGQVVTDFFVKGNYFYYSQNAHHILGELTENGFVSLINRDNQEYGIVSEISQFSDTRCFCTYVFDGLIREKKFFSLNLCTGECYQTILKTNNEQEEIINAMRSSDGTILLQMVNPETTYDDIRKYYLLNESDMHFALCETRFGAEG